MNNSEKLILVFNQYIFKILFEAITLPITYIITSLLDLYEEPYQIKFVDLTTKKNIQNV